VIFENWNRYPQIQNNQHLLWSENFSFSELKTYLPFGKGRSYGDCCLTDTGEYLIIPHLDNILDFNPQAKTITVQAGMVLKDLLEFLAPRGFFLPVVPGTKFITIGGAIANDVHGKGHHKFGSFCNQVEALEIVNSQGKFSLKREDPLFVATCGGLGLTGLIISATLRLISIPGNTIQQNLFFSQNFQEACDILLQLADLYDFSVCWLDFWTKDIAGVVSFGNFSQERSKPSDFSLFWPFKLKLVNKVSSFVLNKLYMLAHRVKKTSSNIHYSKFFFPLDNVLNWNYFYGPKGFLQWQCLLPVEARSVFGQIVKKIKSSGITPNLAVLKNFGSIKPVGLLSFPIEGLTLALDFQICEELFRLLDWLDNLVVEAGGRIYPAKDVRMSKTTFLKSFPKVNEFLKFKDRNFCSRFWKRVQPE